MSTKSTSMDWTKVSLFSLSGLFIILQPLTLFSSVSSDSLKIKLDDVSKMTQNDYTLPFFQNVPYTQTLVNTCIDT